MSGSDQPAKKPPRLGRGLSSLMTGATAPVVSVKPPPAADPPDPERRPDADHQAPKQAAEDRSPNAASDEEPKSPSPQPGPQPGKDPEAESTDGITQIGVDQIAPNPNQPRQRFDEEALRLLAESIRQDGVMQPIIVRPRPKAAAADAGAGQPQQTYELVAGERRWRAAKLVQLPTVPALIRDLSDTQSAEWALVENLQREDLNPIERAEAFRKLTDTLGLSHEQVARRVGVNRSTISNSLRLLGLDERVQTMIRDGALSTGHAKPLAGLSRFEDQYQVAKRIVDDDLSVRQVEGVVREVNAAGGLAGTGAVKPEPSTPEKDETAIHLEDLEKQIGLQLETRVKLRKGRKRGSGTLSIDFYNLDQFDHLMDRLGVSIDND